ncbi:hypothetical protein ACQUQP_19200 [Marinobacterium sp. YM272]|uniref:hypothetical protein n=1 Tax=Marinobacterium sp. YM272 TaxID=3421654 RepID=UPI003D7F3C7A
MIRQLLIRFDTSLPERQELARWVALARALDADLLAQLEEDEALNTLAELPFATEICRSSATHRPLNSASLDRRMQRRLNLLNQLLAEIALQQPFNWQVDRVSPHATRRPEADSALLCIRAGFKPYRDDLRRSSKPHLAVIHSGDSASDHALEDARRIAAELDLPIVLLALPDSPWHRAHDLPPGVALRTDLATLEKAQLKPLLRAWHVNLLILPAPLLRDEEAPLSEVPTLITP